MLPNQKRRSTMKTSTNERRSPMKILLTIGLLILQSTASFAQGSIAGVYGIHLFFNEREFVDVLKIRELQDGSLEGEMHVPNDFDGTIKNVSLDKTILTFDLPVPKNSARPTDLIF